MLYYVTVHEYLRVGTYIIFMKRYEVDDVPFNVAECNYIIYVPYNINIINVMKICTIVFFA